MVDLGSLNEAQAQAVLCTEGPLLVLAGAGSGKTRVLTYRIAHLVEDLGVAPWNILAVTFTNKAAREMRERLGRLLPESIRGMWINTFHGMCVRILRAEGEALGYTRDFTIYDADDSKRLIKDVMAQLGYDTKRYPDNMVRSRISKAKNELITPEAFTPRLGDPNDKVVAAVFAEYQTRLKRANAMDFDDLLLNAYRLFKEHPETARAYGLRWRYILVDEYQDTNKAQYEITKMLAAAYGNLMVVGDDDQSIYSWRGADIRNILEFERDWPECTVVKLEQNYRSTGTILDAANAVIAHNNSRKAKRLFTDGEAGEKIAVYLAADERDEGRWIASEVEKLHRGGAAYRDVAVFYRTNAQSRTLEDMLLRAGVPYVIYGGTRFFDRAEIRDVTAYLKCVVNPADDVSAQRIVNTPRRGIGKTTIQRINDTALITQTSFIEAARSEAADPATRKSTAAALNEFLEVIDEARSYKGDLANVVTMIIEKSGLIAALRAQRTDEAEGRIGNIQEFVSVVQEYVEDHPVVEVEEIDSVDADAAPQAIERAPGLGDFMEWLSLRTDLDSAGEGDDDTITLMTVHSAKGLEFDHVFVAGMEETIFPHSNSMEENGVEEERRLAYVAITRARKRLYLTGAQTRRIFGSLQANAPSRFISEIPENLRTAIGIGSRGMHGTGWEKRGDRHSTYGSGLGEDMYGGRVFGKGARSEGTAGSKTVAKATRTNAAASSSFEVGDHISHKTFGAGVVTGVDGDKLTIRFATGQTKKLLKGYAPIVKVEK